MRSYMYWYEMIVNDHELFPTKKRITHSLKDLKSLLQENINKRFIYFICSRVRVRFSTKKKPKYSLIRKNLILYFEIGKEKKLVKVELQARSIFSGDAIKPDVTVTQKYITLTEKDSEKTTFSVHDFLSEFGISFGLSSKIEYVGYTKNPHKRPIDGKHAGLNDVLYRLSRDEFDIFVYYNLFKVTTSSVNKKKNINFYVANSLTDEVQIDMEGAIIEKCLIMYFNSDNQENNKNKERSELRNSLIKLSEEMNINEIIFNYEMENLNEYFIFGSSSIDPCTFHNFSCFIKQGEVNIKNVPIEYNYSE